MKAVITKALGSGTHGATAAASTSSPQIKPIAGAVALGATVVGLGADAVEQTVRPNMQQVIQEQLLLGVPAEVLSQRYPLYAPIINEIKEGLQ